MLVGRLFSLVFFADFFSTLFWGEGGRSAARGIEVSFEEGGSIFHIVMAIAILSVTIVSILSFLAQGRYLRGRCFGRA